MFLFDVSYGSSNRSRAPTYAAAVVSDNFANVADAHEFPSGVYSFREDQSVDDDDMPDAAFLLLRDPKRPGDAEFCCIGIVGVAPSEEVRIAGSYAILYKILELFIVFCGYL